MRSTRFLRQAVAVAASLAVFSIATSPAEAARSRRSARRCTAKITTNCRRALPTPAPVGAPVVVASPASQIEAPIGEPTRGLLNLINSARSVARSCGGDAVPSAPPLQWDGRLEAAAVSHSNYLVSIGKLTHQGSGGTTPTDRVAALGGPRVPVGETLAFNYPTPEATIEGWMRSPGHCSVIMTQSFQRVAWVRVGAYDTLNISPAQ
jgi:uncharacterized protein YkwD